MLVNMNEKQFSEMLPFLRLEGYQGKNDHVSGCVQVNILPKTFVTNLESVGNVMSYSDFFLMFRSL